MKHNIYYETLDLLPFLSYTLNDYLKTRIVILSAAKNLVFALLRPFASLRVTVLR